MKVQCRQFVKRKRAWQGLKDQVARDGFSISLESGLLGGHVTPPSNSLLWHLLLIQDCQSYRVCISSFALLSHSYHAWTMLHWLRRCKKGGSRVQTSQWLVRKLKECQEGQAEHSNHFGGQQTSKLSKDSSIDRSILLDATGGGWLNAPCSLQFTFAKGVLASVAGRH